MYAIVDVLRRVRVRGRVDEAALADIRGQQVGPDRVNGRTEDLARVTECNLTISDIFMIFISNFILLVFLIYSYSRELTDTVMTCFCSIHIDLRLDINRSELKDSSFY